MSKIRHLIVWTMSNEKIEPPRGVRVSYANASKWDNKIRPIYDAVYAPEYPHIEEAFVQAGKQVYRPNGDTSSNPEPALPNDVSDDEVVDSSEDYKVDIDKMSWQQLRSQAAKISDEPIMSKAQAKEVLKKHAEENN